MLGQTTDPHLLGTPQRRVGFKGWRVLGKDLLLIAVVLILLIVGHPGALWFLLISLILLGPQVSFLITANRLVVHGQATSGRVTFVRRGHTSDYIDYIFMTNTGVWKSGRLISVNKRLMDRLQVYPAYSDIGLRASITKPAIFMATQLSGKHACISTRRLDDFIKVDDELCVLYMPENPSLNCVYEYNDYYRVLP